MIALAAKKLRLLCILSLSVSLAGFAETSTAEPGNSSSDPIRFSLADIDPWAGVDSDGEPYGLLVELVRELETRTGIPIDYHVRPHSRAALELREGTVDFAPTFRAPHVDEIGEPVAAVDKVRRYVIGLKDHEPIDSLDDLAGSNVGYLSGTWYGETFEAHEGFSRVPVRNFGHGLELMQRGRLQAVVATDVAVAASYEPDDGDPGLQVLMELEEGVGMIYKSHKSDRDDAARAIQEAMDSMGREGFLESLFSNRFAPSKE